MKLFTISEGTPDFERGIKSLLDRLMRTYQLVEHTWEESTGNAYKGYFLARHPERLETYKLRDFDTPDAYHIARYWTETEESPRVIKPEYKELYQSLKKEYPDLDQLLQLDGIIVLPDTPDVIETLRSNAIPYDQEGDHVYPDMVMDDEVEEQASQITVDELMDNLDQSDLPIIAKRLYDIYDGNADRWQDYRLDTKSDKQLIDWSQLSQNPKMDVDEADWWKQ